ncbi:TetR/AcrR family transcriptional regulator [Clostridium sp. AF15-17LB]|nr:TetR/AcrR family transcriptional regulator [Clostridium sp. AF15-17LB]
MPRNKYPEETVQKILDVSLKLFLEKGYEETTILDIVDNLGGLSRGAFYHHFKSKDEVLNALSDKMFFENNPFEQVKNENGLNGLEKIQKVLKLQFQNQDLQEINAMSVPLANNPRILAEYIASNQNVLAPLFEELVQEAIKDGSIKDIKYTKAFSSLFAMVIDVWFMPTICPCSKDELIEKLYLIKDMLDASGVPIVDEEILRLSKHKIHHVMENIEKE